MQAAALFAKFMGGPRLLGEESLCMVCVQKQCHVMRMKQKMEKDMKYITNIMKYNHDS
uniref:ZAD domain-containing protein n=1 Tax=Octopus bimaculoides TaxID=37653 RepID=A0A0L8GSW0_OCTBM